MENYKIRVNSKAESKEAQQLFFELGYKKGVCSTGGYPALIIATPESRFQKTPYSSRATSINHEAHSQYKEITLPELRDLVVLKRNDVNDRNVTDPEPEYSANLYLDSKGDLFVFHNPTQTWKESNLNGMDSFYKVLKPITKEPAMKEYLNKLIDGTYKLVVLSDVIDGHDGLIEIPKGAIKAYLNNSKTINFINADDDYMNTATNGEWIDTHRGKHEACGHELIWQRHTHPEELPFIGDECYTNKSDGVFSLPKSEPCDISNWVEIREEGSLNGQYAEIEKVRQDIINSPIHYADSTIECIDAMEAMMTPEQFIGYLRGNVFKYQWRYEKKNGIEDLKKAQWYLDKLTVKVAEKNALF